MLGIPREVAEHALDIRDGSRPVKQRLHRFDEEKRRAIDEEVQKLLVAGFIKEVSHPEWLANPVLVKKKNGVCHVLGSPLRVLRNGRWGGSHIPHPLQERQNTIRDPTET